MRKVLLILGCLLCALPAWSQNTPVTATVTSPNGIVYAFGGGSANIACPGNQQPTFNGFTLQRSIVISKLDGTGTFNLIVYDVNQIQPVGCAWTFSICDQTGIYCFKTGSIGGATQSPVITGGSVVNLSAAISAFAVNLPNPGGAVLLAPTGTQNIIQPVGSCLEINGVCVNAGGSGGAPAGALNSIQLKATSTTFGSSLLQQNTGNTYVQDSGSFNPCGPQPYYDVVCFGASASPITETGTIAASSSTLTLVAAGDFVNGQGIMVPKAGATSTIAAPTAPSGSQVVTVANISNAVVLPLATTGITCTGGVATVTTRGWYGFPNGSSVTLAGTGVSNYNITATLTTVNNFTFTIPATCAGNANGGTATLNVGSTVFTYQVAAMDSLRGYSPATSTFTVTGSALSPQVGNRLTWTNSTGAAQYLVYGDGGLGGALTCKGAAIAVTTPTANALYPTFLWTDYGTAQPCPSNAPTNPPSANTARDLVTTVSSGGGTTSLTLAAASSNAATSVTVEHDDSVAIQAAINAAASNTLIAQGGGGIVNLPTGTYLVEGLTFPTTTPRGFGAMILELSGELITRTPLNLNTSGYRFQGVSGGLGAQQWAQNGAAINGTGVAPLFHVFGVAVIGDSFNNITSTNCSPSCYYIEQDSTGAPTTDEWNSVGANTFANAPGSAIELRGGAFGYSFAGGLYNSQGNSILPTINIVDSGGVGIRGANFVGSGVVFLCDNNSISKQCGNVTLDFANSTDPYEAGNIPLFTSITNGVAFNIGVELRGPWIADPITGQDVPIVKSTGANPHGIIMLTVTGASPVSNNAVLEGNAIGSISCALGTSGCAQGNLPFGGLVGQGIDDQGRVLILSNPAYEPNGGLQFNQITVSQLPAAGSLNVGQIRVVSDSITISAEGQTCVGSSTNTALAFSTGSQWKCF